MKRIGWFSGLMLVLALYSNVSAEDVTRVETYWGVARNDAGKVVYREKHTTYHRDGRILRSVTDYIGPDGSVIAVMDSNYERSLAMPTYAFKDHRRGYEEGLRYHEGAYYIYNRDPKLGEKEVRLEDTENVYSCQGWHYYVVNNLEVLEKNESVVLNLIFPQKLRAYPFRIERTGSSGETLDVKVRFANRLVSWFVPHLDLVYERESRKLLEFQGVSNIFDENDELQEVTITYHDDENAGKE